MVEDHGVIHYDMRILDDRLQGLHAEFGVAPQVVYEAGPCGFGIWRSLSDLGWKVEVPTSTLLPKLPGDRARPTGETPGNSPARGMRAIFRPSGSRPKSGKP